MFYLPLHELRAETNGMCSQPMQVSQQALLCANRCVSAGPATSCVRSRLDDTVHFVSTLLCKCALTSNQSEMFTSFFPANSYSYSFGGHSRNPSLGKHAAALRCLGLLTSIAKKPIAMSSLPHTTSKPADAQHWCQRHSARAATSTFFCIAFVPRWSTARRE